MKPTDRSPVSPANLLLKDLLSRTFDDDQPLLGKLILEKSVGMIAGPRGGGKSWLAMLIAYAIAGKKSLQPWGRGTGARVVILDGEMRASSLQERFQLIRNRDTAPTSGNEAENNLYVISRDCIGDSIGSIDTLEGQRKIDALIPVGIKLLIIDNLSAWSAGGSESANSWALTKTWLIEKRLQGIAVLLIHHTGKNGQQRGSSAHEDLLDYSILLRPLSSNDELKDTRFSIEHTKLRDHIPELREKFDFSIWTEDDMLKFLAEPSAVELSKQDTEILSMKKKGLSNIKIGKALDIHPTTVGRTATRLKPLLEDANSTEA